MDLDQLRIFVRVAELSSFSRAAEELALPKSRVSAAVRALETRLSARLLHRTTRSVRLTQDGTLFLKRAQALLEDADELQSLFQQAPDALRGRLRLDMPTGMARMVVIPRLPEFMARHPLLEFEISTTDRRVDVVQEGFDCVVRVGALQDSGLVARTLGVLPLLNLASPGYLQAHGTPKTLGDLAGHRMVHFAPTLGAAPSGWEYPVAGGGWRFHPVAGSVTVNNADAYMGSCLAGLGIIQAPGIGAHSLMAEGRLVEVMPDFRGAAMPVSLLYANRRNPSKRLLALLDWLADIMAPHLEPSPALANQPSKQ